MNMSKFEEFKQKIELEYPKDTIYRFIEDFFDLKKNPLNGEFKEDLDEVEYDSYGSEDSTLKRVFYFPDFGIFVKFEGTRASYEGEEWDTMKEVKPVEKIISVYEEVNS